jgi:energy-coupling factor transporter ATP-binding protein EcfA2
VATARLSASGPTEGHTFALLHRIVGAIRVLEAPGAHFFWRIIPSWLAIRRIVRRQVPLLSFPLTVNTLEAVGLVAFLLNGISLPGLRLGSSRQVPPSPDTPRRGGVIIGESTYPGVTQPLALLPKDRLMHSYILGPSGTGKSTLMAAMALQDIAAGHGTIVVDPKNNLIDTILARLPAHRRDDVMLLDAAANRSVGFNPLRLHGTEHARELAAETTVHILRTIFKDYWGPRTDDILRAALFSLVQVPAPNGAAFTMCEVPELLTSSNLRRYVMHSPHLDERWRTYWQQYDAKSEAEQLNTVGAALNKLRAFTHRTSLRLVLGQSDGLNISDVFTKRKILLVPLSEGLIGSEAAALLGSLVVGAIWSATLQRSAIPTERRRPTYCHLDEFQSIVRITDDLTDMLTKARGLGLSLTLAHQYAKQLPEPIRAAALGTVRTQIFFQVEYDDAQLVAKRLAPILTADDLMGLGVHEMVARLCVNGHTRPPVSGRTFALSEPIHDVTELKHELTLQHGTP